MQQWTQQWITITTKASSGRCSFPAVSACCAASSSSFSTTATSVCNDTPTRSSLHDGTHLTSTSFDCTPLLPLLLPLTDLVEGSTPACSLCDLMFYALVIGTAATNIFLPSFDFRGTLCGPLGFYAQVWCPTVTLPSVGCGGYMQPHSPVGSAPLPYTQQFFLLLSQLYFCCLSLDLRVALTSPFSDWKRRIRYYHGVSIAIRCDNVQSTSIAM